MFQRYRFSLVQVERSHKENSLLNTIFPFVKVCTGCSLNIVFSFPRILESMPPLPRQHSAVIGCTIGVTVRSHYVESFEGL